MTFRHVVHPQQQVGNRGFTRTRAPDDGHFLTRFQLEIYFFKGGNARIWIRKRYISELNGSRQILGIAAQVDNAGLGIQKLVDALLGSRCLLHNRGNPANGSHRPGEHVDVNHKLGNVARSNRAFNHL